MSFVCNAEAKHQTTGSGKNGASGPPMLENIDLQSKLRHDGNLQDRSHDTSENQADNRNGRTIV